MARPKSGYKLANGEAAPGVTTIIGRFKESGGLLQWAFQQGKSGAATLYAARDEAADIGTIAHGLVEAHINDPRIVMPEIAALAALHRVTEGMAEKALSAYLAYLQWESNFKVVIVEQEMPLVSEIYGFGGTPDAVGFVGDAFCILDWKTSNAIYRDYLLQMAAYKALWEENRPGQPTKARITGFHLLRFGKEAPDFEHRYFGELDKAWQMFLHLLEAYKLDKELKKRVA